MTDAQLLEILREVQRAAVDSREDVSWLACLTDPRLVTLSKPARKLQRSLVDIDRLIAELESKQ